MKSSLAFFLAAAATCLTPVAAQAQTYAGNFSALGTQGNGQGSYFFTGQNASQQFNATGVSSVTRFELSLVGGMGGFYASDSLSLTFQINGVTIGTTTYNPGDSASRQLSFVFNPIASASTNYTLAAFVSDPICDGCGALRLSSQNNFQLIAASVPEPSSWAMMLIGFGALGIAFRRARQQTLVRKESNKETAFHYRN